LHVELPPGTPLRQQRNSWNAAVSASAHSHQMALSGLFERGFEPFSNFPFFYDCHQPSKTCGAA
jgi:hypothetical protein